MEGFEHTLISGSNHQYQPHISNLIVMVLLKEKEVKEATQWYIDILKSIKAVVKSKI